MRQVVLAALLLGPCTWAGQEPDATSVASGFDHFYNLEYPEAIADFQHAIDAHPKIRNSTITSRRRSCFRRCTATAHWRANSSPGPIPS